MHRVQMKISSIFRHPRSSSARWDKKFEIRDKDMPANRAGTILQRQRPYLVDSVIKTAN